jgi:hypothetical protein
MTALTNFELGIVKVLHLKLHKWIELAVGPILVVIPWVLGFAGDIRGRAIFMTAGFVIVLVGQLSQYKSS